MNRPERTCIGCRRRDHKSALVRLVWSFAAVTVDLPQTEPGRGAYLHCTPDCLGQAVRRRAVGRALKIPPQDGSELAEVMAPLVGPASPSAQAAGSLR